MVGIVKKMNIQEVIEIDSTKANRTTIILNLDLCIDNHILA